MKPYIFFESPACSAIYCEIARKHKAQAVGKTNGLTGRRENMFI